MANTAFDHASALTLPGSTTNNGLVRWGDTSGTSFGNITGITSDGSNITLLTRGEIRFSDADSSNFIAFESPATVGTSYTMTLPSDLPAADEVLTVTSYSGGAGVLEWAAAGGGAVSAVANGSDNRIATFSSTTALNGEANLTFDGTHLSVAAQSKIFFDGGSNTYIQELTANNMAFYADGGKQLTIGAGLIMNSDISAQNISFQGSTGFTGDTKVTSGNLVIGTAGKGIDFSVNTGTNPATSTVTVANEVLDYYEEGTFAPHLFDSSRDVSSAAYSWTPAGSYTRIGNRVWFSISWEWSSRGDLTTTQDVKFGGLPFTSSSTPTNIRNSCTIGYISSLSVGVSNGTMLQARVDGGRSDIDVTYTTGGAAFNTVYLKVSDLSGSGSIDVSGHYEVA